MPRSRPALSLREADAQQLQQWVAAFGTPQQVAMRSRIVLAAAAGQSDSAIARDLEVNRNTVTLWRTRFQQEGHYTSLPQRSSPGARFGTLAGSLLTGALRM